MAAVSDTIQLCFIYSVINVLAGIEWMVGGSEASPLRAGISPYGFKDIFTPVVIIETRCCWQHSAPAREPKFLRRIESLPIEVPSSE